MDFIHTIASQSQLPVVTAFLLGLVVALHPCPLATNIAAMGYIARNTGRSRLFVSGMFYTLGRVLAYTLLGVALLLLFGVYLLLAPRLHRHAHCPHVVSGGHRFHGTWGSLLLGAILALTFCPESAVVYFGMLMPLSVQESGGMLLPAVFALATSLPTLLLVWLLSFRLNKEAKVISRLQKIQKTAHLLCAVLFILAGIFCLFF